MDRNDLLTASFTLPITLLDCEIREGDGHTERLLTKKNKKTFEVFPEFLASIVTRLGEQTNITKDDILDLPVPDSEYIAIESYKLNFGEFFEFDQMCPECGKDGFYKFDLNTLEYIVPPETDVPTDPQLSVKLPRSGYQAVVGVLDGHREQLLLSQIATGSIDMNQADFQCLRSLNGSTEFSYEEVAALKRADHAAIRRARKRLVCGYDTTIEVQCQYCEESIVVNVLTHRNFLLPGG